VSATFQLLLDKGTLVFQLFDLLSDSLHANTSVEPRPFLSRKLLKNQV
jgi:hypothetical protein